MGKKERLFPISTIGGRIYALRNKLGFHGDGGRIDFYDFLFSDVPGEKEILKETKRKNVYNWECSEDSIPIPVLKKICEKCDCSSDYLLDIEKERNHDIHFIHNYTGLSEDSINILNKNKNSYFPFIVSTINFLLENDEYINDKLELLKLIPQYILVSQNIKSYDECDVSKMENSDITLRDEYGTAAGFVPVNKMANVLLLSINETLSTLRNNISTNQIRRKPTIYDILDAMLSDLIYMEEIRKNIDGFNFDIDNLSRKNRRFEENKKRLIYLYDCDTIDKIDFEKFKTLYPEYDDKDIEFLKENLDL